jgi:YHS domain-containing protein
LTPIRIVIIGILIYIIYRLLIGPRKSVAPGKQNLKGGHGTAVDDVLVKDPVCNTYVPKGQALVLLHNRQTYHFCSDACRKTFLAEKEKE